MFHHYDLSGKQVVLVIRPDYLEALAGVGITGSPMTARVNKVEDHGLWLENPHFAYCPTGTKRLYSAQGQTMCMAHVFIPAQAILSVAVFPNDAQDLEKDPEFHPIGFSLPHSAPKKRK